MKRALRLACLLLPLCLTAGCAGGAPAPSGETVSVYYLSDWAANDMTDELLRAVALQPDGADPVSFCLGQLFAAPPSDEGLVSPFEPGTRPVSHTLWEGLLTLDLSPEYALLAESKLTMAEACLALTLCALPEVSEVQLTVDGEPYPPQGKNRFSTEDFSLDALVLKPVDQILTLYFVDPFTLELIPEEWLVIKRENEPAERYVLDGLLGGPKTDGLSSALPHNAPLLNVSTRDGVCYINFAAEFYDMPPPFTHELAIQAVTRALMALPDVEAVQFLCDDLIAAAYGDVPLATPLP